MKIGAIITFLLLSIGMLVRGQEFRMPEIRNIKIQVGDTLACFEILPETPEFKLFPDKFYYWYGSSRIFCNGVGGPVAFRMGKRYCFQPGN